MGRAPDDDATAVPAIGNTLFCRRIETVTAALTAIKNLSRKSDPEAERQFKALAADMQRYLDHLKRRHAP
jgi:hypothetical protein